MECNDENNQDVIMNIDEPRGFCFNMNSSSVGEEHSDEACDEELTMVKVKLR